MTEQSLRRSFVVLHLSLDLVLYAAATWFAMAHGAGWSAGPERPTAAAF